VGKGDVIVERASLFSFKNCSLVIGFSRVAVLGENTLDKGNHFLNKFSKIGLE
jgi:hypothetical protein